MKFSDIHRFPGPVWIVLLGTLLTRASFFMVWPFMAVILHNKFNMPLTQIGAILSLTALTGAIFSLYVGYLTDKIGRKGVIVIACVTYVTAFVVLAVADSASIFALGAIIVGLSRSMLEPPAKAMIADLIEETKLRELAYHVRYYVINIGAAVGPLLGLRLGITGAQTTFWIVAAAYAAWGLGFVWIFRRMNEANEAPKSLNNFRETLNVLRDDHAFLLLVLANALVMYSYMHIDTSLVMHLSQLGDRVIEVYTPLMFINASVIVLFQFPLLKLLQNQTLLHRVYIGLVGFAAAFVMFGLIPLTAPVYWWYLAMIVLSLGEVILFPTFSLLIDRIAPDDMRGTYFGAGGLGSIGISLSPLIGGIVLQFAGGGTLFISTAFVLAFAGYLYKQSAKSQNKKTQGEMQKTLSQKQKSKIKEVIS